MFFGNSINEHSGPKTYQTHTKKHTNNIPKTYQQHTKNIPTTYQKHTKNIKKHTKKHSRGGQGRPFLEICAPACHNSMHGAQSCMFRSRFWLMRLSSHLDSHSRNRYQNHTAWKQSSNRLRLDWNQESECVFLLFGQELLSLLYQVIVRSKHRQCPPGIRTRMTTSFF